MKGFERRQIKKSFALPLLHLTSIFLSVCLTFALRLVLCYAGTTSVCSFDTDLFNLCAWACPYSSTNQQNGNGEPGGSHLSLFSPFYFYFYPVLLRRRSSIFPRLTVGPKLSISILFLIYTLLTPHTTSH